MPPNTSIRLSMSTNVQPDEGKRPLITVVVPTHDRPDRLERCLEALARQRYPANRFEVVVSDDGSPFPADAVLPRFRDRPDVRFTRGPKRGPAVARNRGAMLARGRYLAFVDDDCTPAPDWLAALERRLEATPNALVGGGIVNALTKNPYSTATELIVGYVYDHAARCGTEPRFFNASNLAMAARGFREQGGFSEEFPLPAGEDYDFCHRWQHAGGPVVYAPEAKVDHAHPLTLRSFLVQHYRYGRGLLFCRLRMAARSGQPMRGRSAAFYLGLVRHPLAQDAGARGWLHAALVAVSQVATAAGVVREALHRAGGGVATASAADGSFSPVFHAAESLEASRQAAGAPDR
jgi:GT2 family glycosyltransferase